MHASARGYGAKVLVVFSILTLPFAALAQNAETAWKQCRAVDTAHAARVQACTRAIESGTLGNSDRAWAYASRANGHRSQFDFPPAERDFAAALKLNANHLFVRLSRAKFLEQQGKKEDARKEYEWLAGRSVSEAQDYVWRGDARGSLRRYEEAIADYTKAIALRPKDAEAYALRAGAYLSIGGRDKERFEDLTQAIELNYPDASVYISRAYLFARNDQHEAAIGDYTRAISLAPNKAYAHAGRCQSQAVLGRDLDRALKDCDTAI